LLEIEGLGAKKLLELALACFCFGVELALACFGVDMLARLGVDMSLEVLPALPEALLKSITKYK
jgi:hypothetical protein